MAHNELDFRRVLLNHVKLLQTEVDSPTHGRSTARWRYETRWKIQQSVSNITLIMKTDLQNPRFEFLIGEVFLVALAPMPATPSYGSSPPISDCACCVTTLSGIAKWELSEMPDRQGWRNIRDECVPLDQSSPT